VKPGESGPPDRLPWKQPEPAGRDPYQDRNQPPPEPLPEPPPKSLQERENAWDQGRKQGWQETNTAKDAVASGDPTKIRDSALEMQGDKQGLYEINRQNSPEAEQTRVRLKQELNNIYNQTDQKTCQDLAQQNGWDVRDVESKNITNAPRPGAEPKGPPDPNNPDKTFISYDRDVTFERVAKPPEWVPDESHPGQWRPAKKGTYEEMVFDKKEGWRAAQPGDQGAVMRWNGDWVDVPSNQSAPVYNKNFQQTALAGASDAVKGTYANMTPDQFAHAMDQTVTDRLANDAYGRGPSDLDTATKDPTGNFSDPAGIGKTVQFKADEWFTKADHDTNPAQREADLAEGMRQTAKQYNNLVNARLYAINQNRPPGAQIQPPEKLQQAYQILKGVEQQGMSPAEADSRLAKLGTNREKVASDLGDYVRMLFGIPVKP